MNPHTLPTEAILNASAHLLRPLVRLMLRVGITFPVLAERLRMLFVEVAASSIEQDKARTDSRLSLATGIHRKEIRRLREAGGGAPVPALREPSSVTLTSALIARWLATPTDDVWLLPRSAASGPSFDALVRSVTTDVRPRAVLDEFLAQGIVTLEAGDRVRLNMQAFIPAPGAEAQLFYFGRNLHDHIAAAAANVLSTDHAPFPDLSLHYDRLSTGAADALDAAARAASARLMQDINRQAAAIAAADDASPKSGPTRRVNFGIYLYVEDEQGKEERS
ncbi:hypothetical protein ACELLULO517_14980 [Acidisoma cellulosilytica]|uniref:Uncharacterized protein n=1 Tax=Acidisoma cellulosilyticum TaxID=2802395 RepID=A0A964E524_9PROT|nr:DUF6502 family protein [Acidisoma cellulosilyticum]MCB8881553.1 hypothetical protein [Acidisoma cellulosilyticum]